MADVQRFRLGGVAPANGVVDRADLGDTLRLEMAQGFSNGCPPNAGQFVQFGFDQTLAGREPTRRDRGTKPVFDLQARCGESADNVQIDVDHENDNSPSSSKSSNIMAAPSTAMPDGPSSQIDRQ